MNNIYLLHKQAMDIAEMAFYERFRGEIEKSKELFNKAYELEKEAALLTPEDINSEPSRSVLFRSAASIALNCKRYREAEKMIALALAGDPPTEIAGELRDLYEQINFERHLDLKGIMLEHDEFQLSLAGYGTGWGIIKSEEFINRIDTIKTMAYRTIERQQGKTFREKGTVPKNVRENYEPYISIPRAASFAVTIKIGKPKDQGFIPGFETGISIIDDILSKIKHIDNERFDILEKEIPDEAYLRNFIGLARNLAPDGENISIVGFTIVRNKKEKRVSLTKKQKDISLVQYDKYKQYKQVPITDEPVQITGVLSYADAETSKIKLTEENSGKRYNVIVPEGLLSDIVKPYWEDIVTIVGHVKGEIIYLKDIIIPG